MKFSFCTRKVNMTKVCINFPRCNKYATDGSDFCPECEREWAKHNRPTPKEQDTESWKHHHQQNDRRIPQRIER